jgi:hypothetical protein
MINTDQPIIDPSNDKLASIVFAQENSFGFSNFFEDKLAKYL